MKHTNQVSYCFLNKNAHLRNHYYKIENGEAYFYEEDFHYCSDNKRWRTSMSSFEFMKYYGNKVVPITKEEFDEHVMMVELKR